MDYECHYNTYTFGDATFGDVQFFGEKSSSLSPLVIWNGDCHYLSLEVSIGVGPWMSPQQLDFSWCQHWWHSIFSDRGSFDHQHWTYDGIFCYGTSARKI